MKDKLISRNSLVEFANNSNVGIDANDIMRFPTIPAIPIPDNATNGDIIKALFNIKEVEMSSTYCVHFPEEEDFGHYFFKDWWNSPYKRGETE